MDAASDNKGSADPAKTSDVVSPSSTHSEPNATPLTERITSPTSGVSSLGRSLSLPQSVMPEAESETENAAKSDVSLEAKNSDPNEIVGSTSVTPQPSVFGSLAKGLLDSSLFAVKAFQLKARHIVSQNKRRYQEGGFDLDLTYITDNIIAMGFPAGDRSSGFFGFVEGFYRNQMEEVIRFFETHHKGKYKVYNLCTERLYDAALFGGKVACFPFDDHNSPPIHLILLFCQSCYSWLKENILNVVVVHCKAGRARTGLMICSLLLYLKLFATAEECIDHYNQKRCVDGKGLIKPSQIRYVKYFERILTNFNGETPPGRRCMLRGFRLHQCPYWVRPAITISDHTGILFSTKKHPKTKDLLPDDFWIRAPSKGIIVFALPGEPGLTELTGDFKIDFHDSHGDFSCWLNTTMTENRIFLNPEDLDSFDKRKAPAPGFQVEVVMIDYDGTLPTRYKAKKSDGRSKPAAVSSDKDATSSNQSIASENQENDNVFSDSDGEEAATSGGRSSHTASGTGKPLDSATTEDQTVTHGTKQLSTNSAGSRQGKASDDKKQNASKKESLIPNLNSGDIKAIAADASVFSFGDEEDYLSE
ncbi:phosphatidylinositol 3,4,5-trisphosphate 3-phosphatase and protein-tyrosine-phosphatase PTEN2A-like [Heracleum sosnowskyi]|uniref:Phosphatidylinositol 3,4,5-trisphosphate 3-phosphatase and protein-tyrosine-phosphatase PTEN2A-like n=1 Tax=Heracleum sosnowskyi TaxID=360622 RepID=A0AAD8MRY7_9APIA|nr:phosphatidylinositol 3,4,5-trisphosphate 3-phosphatase and protein-tyrosine-phosphatase PTEN2A-like [Heracleum sosnowskyi]